MDRLTRTVVACLIVTLVLASCGGGTDRERRARRSRAERDDRRTSSTVASAAPTTTASPSPSQQPDLTVQSFSTPSGNITCFFDGKALWCDIATGLSPPPAAGCEGGSDYAWLGVRVLAYGGASPFCASETLKGTADATLTYGQTWSRDGITCDSQSTGLTCSNATDDGFFLSRAEWRIASSTTGPAVRGDSFQTPSGNIACARVNRLLRCDIGSGLVPEPGEHCTLDWVGMLLGSDGKRARPMCAGDTVLQSDAPVLGYGRQWRGAAMTCDSQEAGLVCWNEFGHGFTLSRARWRAFSTSRLRSAAASLLMWRERSLLI